MSFRSSTWRSASSRFEAQATSTKAPSTTALEFFAALASSNLEVWRSSDLNLVAHRPQKAGQGGFALVEIGKTPDKKPIVVKKSLKVQNSQFVDQTDAFSKHFEQLSLELRILSYHRFKEHANIVNLLGLCAEDYSRVPSISLVLEYAAFNTLDKFLASSQLTDLDDKIRCALQVSSGLDALHEFNICHGDVKTRNILVFSVNGRWVYKISDFGSSVVLTTANTKEEVKIPRGTPLYDAPEIRRLNFAANSTFSIQNALSTDVFSFGLLVWEVLNQGTCFFDNSWCFKTAQDLGLEDMIDALVEFPHNALLHHGLAFIESKHLPHHIKDCLANTLRGSLQDSPQERYSMNNLRKLLQRCDGLQSNETDEQNVAEMKHLPSWTDEHTLHEMLDFCLQNSMIDVVREEPFKTVMHELVFSELVAIVACPTMSQAVRAHAAMTICEYCFLGLGDSKHDDIIFWLEKASLQLSCKARSWLPRFCSIYEVRPSTENPMLTAEELLNDIANEQYLSSRIRLYRFNFEWIFKPFHEHTKPRMYSELLDSVSLGSLCSCPNSVPMELLLLAAFAGDDLMVQEMVTHPKLDAVSRFGYGPVHLACIGGHLSTLEILLKSGFSAFRAAPHGIVPLHICIFFAEACIVPAVDLLVRYGADPGVHTTCRIIWEDHDLVLFGTPLDWAIQTRNTELVRALLSRTPHSGGLRAVTASSLFFWDILDQILEGSQEEKIGMRSYNSMVTIKRPFNYWIAHGRELFKCIDRTLEVYQKHGVPLIFEAHDGSTTLMTLITLARMHLDLYLIERLIGLMSSTQVKKCNNDGGAALIIAIIRATNDSRWSRIVESLVEHYTIAELETETMHRGSYLHIAVTADSTIGAQALLKKGVNFNQRTFESCEQTPLHLCIGRSGSIEMCSLLLSYGADISIKEKSSMSTPLIRLVRKWRQGSSRLLDHVLTFDLPEAVYVDLLHETSYRFWSSQNEVSQTENLFGHLLKIPKVAKHMNDLDARGVTLLQRSAYQASLEAVELLLEAGADVTLGITHNNKMLYPLQIACVVSRVNFTCPDEDEDGGVDSITREREAERAVRMCIRLLARHHAVDHGQFCGITQLHIASYVGLPDAISRFQEDSGSAEGKGQWPGLVGSFTADALVREAFAEDLPTVVGLRPD